MSDEPPPPTDPGVAPDGNGERHRKDRLGVGESHRVLASSRRRVVLCYLMDRVDETTHLEDLVAAVIDSEKPDPGPASHWIRVETALHHVHLPKLDDAGVIDYDPDNETVRYTASKPVEALLVTSLELEGGRGD